MKATNIFRTPHKALRYKLCEALMMTSALERDDIKAINELKSTIEELFEVLQHHAQIEEDYILPFLAKKVNLDQLNDSKEHHELEQEQLRLQMQLQSLNNASTSEEWHNFYLAFGLFAAQHFQHMFQEEKITNQLFEENVSNEETQELRKSFLGTMTEHEMHYWIKAITAAHSSEDNRAIVAMRS